MFEQGGTLYAIVQIGNQVMQGSTVGNLQAYTIDANGNATRYGTWALSSPDWNVQALAPVASPAQPPAGVPEPFTMLFLGFSLFGAGALSRKMKK
jgi:hypothetical protein